MINRTAIQQWSEHAPWIDNAQIEQDLIICRALVSIFSDEFLASQLAFRGGTANSAVNSSLPYSSDPNGCARSRFNRVGCPVEYPISCRSVS